MNCALPRTVLSTVLAQELFRISPMLHSVFELSHIMGELAGGRVEDIWQHDTPDGFILEVKVHGRWHRLSFTNIGEDWGG